MPLRPVYTAQIDHLQILDEEGRLDEKLAKDTLTDEQVVFLYERMIECRQLDEIAFKLQRSGRIFTYPQNKGAGGGGAGVWVCDAEGDRLAGAVLPGERGVVPARAADGARAALLGGG